VTTKLFHTAITETNSIPKSY